MTVACALATVIYLVVDDYLNPPTEGGLASVGNAFAAAFVMLMSFAALVFQSSLYFNLRYFLLHRDKTPLKTFFNVLILIVTVCLAASAIWMGVKNTDGSGQMFFRILSLLGVLWTVNCFIPYADGRLPAEL